MDFRNLKEFINELEINNQTMMYSNIHITIKETRKKRCLN